MQIPIVPESIQIQYRGGPLDTIVSATEGIRLQSDMPVMLYVHVEASTGQKYVCLHNFQIISYLFSADSFLVFPVSLLGMRYRAATCSLLSDATINANMIGVIALQDNTQVSDVGTFI